MATEKKIEAKHFLDRVTGKTYRSYTFKRRPCRRVELKSRLVDQLAGYTLIEKDLRSVAIWLAEIEKLHTEGPKRKTESFAAALDRDKYNLVKGLFVAALTFYGKCFSKCEGRPVKLERVQLDSALHELHDTCMELRHNFAAHSGAKRIEHVEIALVFPSKPALTPPYQIFRELHQPDLMWPEHPDKTLLELAQEAKRVVELKIEKLLEKITNEDIVPNARKYGLLR